MYGTRLRAAVPNLLYYIEESRHRRVPCRYQGKDIRCFIRIRKVCEIIHKSEWYRVGQFVFRLWVLRPGMEDFFYFIFEK